MEQLVLHSVFLLSLDPTDLIAQLIIGRTPREWQRPTKMEAQLIKVVSIATLSVVFHLAVNNSHFLDFISQMQINQVFDSVLLLQ